MSTLSEQESTVIKIRKTNYVWILSTFFSQLRRLSVKTVVNEVKILVLKRKGEFEFKLFFSNRSARTRSRRHLLNRSRDFFVPRTRASFAHSWAGSPPLLTRGLEGIFCSPTWTPEGFHLRAFRGHGDGNISRFCLSLYWRDMFWYRFIGWVFYLVSM